MFRESLLPIIPFRHVPFPDTKEIRENVHSAIVVLVVVVDPPAMMITDALTFTTEVDEDVTVMDRRVSDPAEI